MPLSKKDPMLITASIWPTLRPVQKDHRVRTLFGRMGIELN
jgi:hypothetical protein